MDYSKICVTVEDVSQAFRGNDKLNTIYNIYINLKKLLHRKYKWVLKH